VNPLEQNPTLSGLLIDSTRQPGMIETTGTDGFHLCYAKEKYDGEKFKIIVNINTLKQLNSLISENGTKNPVFFYLQNNQLITQVDNSMMLCRLLEGNYPSAMKTIEGTNPFKLTIDKTEILNGVERGMVLASGDKKPSIAMNIQPNKIKLVCRSAEYGTSYEEINITSNLKEPTTISLNAKLLLDLIKNIDSEKIIFEFTANNKPILIKNENNTNYVSLILPIRNI
jgi:DNA polymerase-3 subunit beta